MNGSDILITTLAERPELAAAIWSDELMSAWPPFMLEDPMAQFYFGRGFLERYHGHVLVAVDAAQPDTVVARAFSVPFLFGSLGRDELPDGGWGTVVRWAHSDAVNDRVPNAVSALEITVRPDCGGRGLSGRMLAAMRSNAARLGFADLYAPVRPSLKHLEPTTPSAEYAARTREDGLPHDAWLRVHVRAGGRIVRIAPHSMVIAGTLRAWRGWTGAPLDESGPAEIPGGLVPLHVSVEHDHAVYVEPNVWVHHRVR